MAEYLNEWMRAEAPRVIEPSRVGGARRRQREQQSAAAPPQLPTPPQPGLPGALQGEGGGR